MVSQKVDIPFPSYIQKHYLIKPSLVSFWTPKTSPPISQRGGIHSAVFSGSQCSFHLTQEIFLNFWPWSFFLKRQWRNFLKRQEECWFCTGLLSPPLPQADPSPCFVHLVVLQESPDVHLNLEVQVFPCCKQSIFHCSLSFSLTCKGMHGFCHTLPDHFVFFQVSKDPYQVILLSGQSLT